jgi:hypothetical protein
MVKFIVWVLVVGAILIADDKMHLVGRVLGDQWYCYLSPGPENENDPNVAKWMFRPGVAMISVGKNRGCFSHRSLLKDYAFAWSIYEGKPQVEMNELLRKR